MTTRPFVSCWAFADFCGLALLFCVSLSVPAHLAAQEAAKSQTRVLPSDVRPVDKTAVQPVSKPAAPFKGDTIELPKSAANPDNFRIDVAVGSEQRCMLGDLDAMMLDLQSSKGKLRMQITIEPLNAAAGKEAAYAPPNDASEHKKGDLIGVFSAEVPEYASPTVVGLFICSIPAEQQNENQEPCSAKPLMSIEAAMMPYKVDAQQAFKIGEVPKPAPLVQRGNKETTFKIYFFAFGILSGNKLVIPTNSLTDSGYAALMQHLKALDADVTDYPALESDLKKYGETLGSIPLKTHARHIEVVLPFYSEKKCAPA